MLTGTKPEIMWVSFRYLQQLPRKKSDIITNGRNFTEYYAGNISIDTRK